MKADTDFADELLAVARGRSADPFGDTLTMGRWTRDDVRRYATALVGVAAGFPRRLCAILSICDDPEVRTALIENLLEEEGVVGYEPGKGLRIIRERHHAELARRFARAAGASETEIDAAVSAARESRWFADAIRNGDWLAAFAYVAVGHESNVPDTFRRIVPPLVERYGFSLDDLVFLTEHYTADERHGNDSAFLIARVAQTEDARHRAVDGARRGGNAWRAWPRTCLA